MITLVTGGAGFIGSHLAAKLVEQGHHVTILDNLSSGKSTNIADIEATFIQGDIRDFDTVYQAAANCDVIFHQAAYVSSPQSISHPQINHQINVDGTFNVFEAARQHNVKRVVYASSAAVYGNHPQLPKTESSPIQPQSPYGASKYISDVYASMYAQLYSTSFVGLRYMNVFGPRQDPHAPYAGVLSIFCQNRITNQSCTISGDGEQTRDFVYIDDIVQANLRAATANLPSKAELFNIGRGQATSLNQIISILNKLGDTHLDVCYTGKERAGDIKHSFANISKAKQQLGYNPQTDLTTGLKKTLDWLRLQSTT